MFRHWLSSWSAKKKTLHHGKCHLARPGLECLETRELLSATFPGYVLDGGGNLYNTAVSSQQPIDTGVQNFTVVNNKVFDLHTDGTLDLLNTNGSGKVISASGIASFAAAPSGRVYALTTGGLLMFSDVGHQPYFSTSVSGIA